MVHVLVLVLAVVGPGALATAAFAGAEQMRPAQVAVQTPTTARRAQAQVQVPVGAMPNLVGMTQTDAERHAFVRKFELNLIAAPRQVAGVRAGTIVEQSIPAGERVSMRSRVAVYVATAPDNTGSTDTPTRGRGFGAELGDALLEALKPTIVPSVLGMDERAATAVLARSELKARVRVEQAPSNPGLVFRQKPEARRRAPKGSTVEVVIARAPDTTPTTPTNPEPPTDPPIPTREFVTVPSVLGSQRTNAEALVRERRLTPSFDEDVESLAAPGMVVRQIPEAGTQVVPGAAVRATIAVGVVVPNLVTVAATDARGARLSAASLGIDERTEVSGAAPSSTVLRQTPDAGTRVARGSVVALFIATPPPAPPPVAVTPVAPPVAPPVVPPVVPPQPPTGPPAVVPPGGVPGGGPAVTPPIQPTVTTGGGAVPVVPIRADNDVIVAPVPGLDETPARWPGWIVALVLAGLVAYRFVRANAEDAPPPPSPEPEVHSFEPPASPLHLEPHVGGMRSRLETGPTLIAFELRLRASADAGSATAHCDGALIGDERRIYE